LSRATSVVLRLDLSRQSQVEWQICRTIGEEPTSRPRTPTKPLATEREHGGGDAKSGESRRRATGNRRTRGTPLCQDAAGSVVLDWVAGPGCGLSEEPMSGVRSVTLELTVVPDCPPGPAASRRFWSASIWAKTTLDSRRLRARMAIIDGIPRPCARRSRSGPGLVAQLDDGHDVQRPVDPPVACPR
jgi:hypothetical protein